MHHKDPAASGPADVELDNVDRGRERQPEGFMKIFEDSGGIAPVGDDKVFRHNFNIRQWFRIFA
jgi:hypothetical protein